MWTKHQSVKAGATTKPIEYIWLRLCSQYNTISIHLSIRIVFLPFDFSPFAVVVVAVILLLCLLFHSIFIWFDAWHYDVDDTRQTIEPPFTHPNICTHVNYYFISIFHLILFYVFSFTILWFFAAAAAADDVVICCCSLVTFDKTTKKKVFTMQKTPRMKCFLPATFFLFYFISFFSLGRSLCSFFHSNERSHFFSFRYFYLFIYLNFVSK